MILKICKNDGPNHFEMIDDIAHIEHQFDEELDDYLIKIDFIDNRREGFCISPSSDNEVAFLLNDNVKTIEKFVSYHKNLLSY